MRDSVRRFAGSGWRFITTSWLIVGATLALLLLAESCYRFQGTARSMLRGSQSAPSPPDPQAGFAWYAEYQREDRATQATRWHPYVYFRRVAPYSGRYINIDSLGRRVTPQPSTPSVPAARVFFFGGSTAWGWAQRDDHTIAAEMSRRLQTVAGPGARIEVTNFGETGWVMTQEILELLLQLRRGNRPDVVVFFDGINDVAAVVQNGVGGIPINEGNRVVDFELGRTLGAGGSLGKDIRVQAAIAGLALNKLQIVQRAQRFALEARAPSGSRITSDSLVRALVRSYADNVRIIEMMSREYGFDVVYVWQPTIQATTKRLTPFEEQLIRSMQGPGFWGDMLDIHRSIPGHLDTAMTKIGNRFVNESSLFAGDTMSVFTDNIGHNTEASIPGIVDGFWPVLREVVNRRLKGKSPSSP